MKQKHSKYNLYLWSSSIIVYNFLSYFISSLNTKYKQQTWGSYVVQIQRTLYLADGVGGLKFDSSG